MAWRSAKRRARAIEREATAVTRWSVFRRTVATKSPAIVPGASTPGAGSAHPRSGGTRTAGNHPLGVVTLSVPEDGMRSIRLLQARHLLGRQRHLGRGDRVVQVGRLGGADDRSGDTGLL